MKHKLTLWNRKVQKLFKVHQAFVVILTLLIISLLVVLRISSLSNLRADEAYLNEESNKVKTVNFNQEAIKEIEGLRNSNVSAPGTQLPNNRQNPFSE